MRLSRITEIIQTEVNVICRSEAEADNADRGLNNSDILKKRMRIKLKTDKKVKHFANPDGLVGSVSFFSLKYLKKTCFAYFVLFFVFSESLSSIILSICSAEAKANRSILTQKYK